MQPQPKPTPNGSYCVRCGHFNPAQRTNCEYCDARLVSLERVATGTGQGRPGCVTAYVGLTAILVGLFVLVGLYMGVRGPAEEGTGFYYLPPDLILGFFLLVAAGLYLVLTRGLWLMKLWARTAVLVIHTVGIVSSLYSAISVLNIRPYTLDRSGYTIQLVGAVIALVIGGVILDWFWMHGEDFHERES